MNKHRLTRLGIIAILAGAATLAVTDSGRLTLLSEELGMRSGGSTASNTAVPDSDRDVLIVGRSIQPQPLPPGAEPESQGLAAGSTIRGRGL
jgi:hypothetical protein